VVPRYAVNDRLASCMVTLRIDGRVDRCGIYAV